MQSKRLILYVDPLDHEHIKRIFIHHIHENPSITHISIGQASFADDGRLLFCGKDSESKEFHNLWTLVQTAHYFGIKNGLSFSHRCLQKGWNLVLSFKKLKQINPNFSYIELMQAPTNCASLEPDIGGALSEALEPEISGALKGLGFQLVFHGDNPYRPDSFLEKDLYDFFIVDNNFSASYLQKLVELKFQMNRIVLTVDTHVNFWEKTLGRIAKYNPEFGGVLLLDESSVDRCHFCINYILLASIQRYTDSVIIHALDKTTRLLTDSTNYIGRFT